MKLIDTMKELGCDYYYIIELCDDEDIDDCLEYYTAADDVNEDLFDCEVIDYDHISKEFAVIYLDVDTLENEENIEDFILEKDVDILLDAFRNLVQGLDKPISIAFASDPDKQVIAFSVKDETVFYPYESYGVSPCKSEGRR